MFTTRFQVVYLISTLIVFCLVALFTRARVWRIVGAVCSVLVFTAISAPIDNLGARWGLWTYPSCTNPPHPPLIVVFVALVVMRVIAGNARDDALR